MIGRNMSNIDAAGNYPRPKAGAYIIRITKAINNPGKERTEFEFDIARGQFAGHYQDLYDRAGFWGGKFQKSYTDKALPFYKGFTEAVVASNADTEGLVIGDYEDVDETKFVNKLVGLVVGEREYIGNDGKQKIGWDMYNAIFLPVKDIEAGNYKVPELVPLEEKAAPFGNVVDTTADMPEGFSKVNDNDIPF